MRNVFGQIQTLEGMVTSTEEKAASRRTILLLPAPGANGLVRPVISRGNGAARRPELAEVRR